MKRLTIVLVWGCLLSLADCACSVMRDSAIQYIALNMHNCYRSYFALGQSSLPTAKSMLRMKIDEELVQGAQRVAQTCVFEHSPDPSFRGGPAGENLAYRMETGLKREAAVRTGITAWVIGELPQLNGDMSYSHGAGHLTQAIWAQSEYLGCAVAYGDIYTGGSNYVSNAFYTVCHYGPAGNMNGKPMYETGKTCSGCPDGYTCLRGQCADSQSEASFSEERCEELDYEGDKKPDFGKKTDRELAVFSNFSGDLCEDASMFARSCDLVPCKKTIGGDDINLRCEEREGGDFVGTGCMAMVNFKGKKYQCARLESQFFSTITSCVSSSDGAPVCLKESSFALTPSWRLLLSTILAFKLLMFI